MSDMGLSCLKNEKIKLVLSFLKVFTILLMLLTSCAFSVMNVSADADDDKRCNDGDVVTVTYPSGGVEFQDNDGKILKEVEVPVGEQGVAGKNFLIVIRCEGENYNFSTLKLSDGNEPYSDWIPTFSLDEIESDSAVGWVTVNGVNVGFQMKSVKQNNSTTNPDTGLADNAYDPTQSVAENNENGNVIVTNDTVDVGADDLIVCQGAKGAESLGWIVCPALTWMAKASDTVYTEYVAPNLQVQPELFNGGNSNVRDAWGTFRDMANVIFVVLLLFVIFSQLTGVGIDNYGIKRILPKMIVAAILINLSYLICVLLVDISNILGNGLQAIFASFSSQLGENGVIQLNALPDSEFLVDNVPQPTFNIGSVLSGIGLFGAAAVMIGAVWANHALLLSLLIGGLGIVVSIFFLFVLLAARKAAIIVLTVISPLAVAAYMLPNTKKLFDKWWNFFKGLLLVYPIAGLLVGAGDYVSRLLLVSSDGFFMWITAMVVSVAPIFFIPSVLKSSFAAMGKIGGMLAGMGAAASRTTKQQVRARGGEIAKKIASTDRFRMARNAIGMKSPFKRGRARAVQDAAALMRERSLRDRLSDRDNMKTQLASIASAEEAKAVDEATMQRLSLMRSSGSGGGIYLDADPKNGIKAGPAAFTLNNAKLRLGQLEEKSRSSDLTSAEKQEISALSRGLAGMSGGAGKIAGIIRGAQDSSGNANERFMSVMGEIYARDALVQSKLNEKDAGASVYTEQFMPGGNKAMSTPPAGGTAPATSRSFSTYKATEASYQDDVLARAKTPTLGLNQSGEALNEYIGMINSGALGDKKVIYQQIMDNDGLINSLDSKDFDKVSKNAELAGVTGKSVTMVDTAKGGRADTAMQATAQNTADTVLTTRQTAINTNATAKAAERAADAGEQTVERIEEVTPAVQQTAINTYRTANASEETADASKQNVLIGQQNVRNTYRTAKAAESGVKETQKLGGKMDNVNNTAQQINVNTNLGARAAAETAKNTGEGVKVLNRGVKSVERIDRGIKK